MTEKGRITKAATKVGFFTFVSRVLGYIRDAGIAFIFGAGFASDAFFVAFRIANLLRRLVGEGAITHAFVPVFTEIKEKRGTEEASLFVRRFFTIFFVILVGLATAGIIFSDRIVALLAPGFEAVEGKFDLTVSLARIMFPYMVFIGLMAASMGVLNSMRHFTMPALSPVFFNLSLIGATFLAAPLLREPAYALAYGVVFGGLLQFGTQLPVLKRYGMFPYPPLFDLRDPELRRIFRLIAPAVVSIGIYQLNIFVTMRFASLLPEGSVSYLYYASRLVELPIGVFGVAFTQAALPTLSGYVVGTDRQGFLSSLSFSIRMVNFVNIPATVGLMVLATPLVDTLFARGQFTLQDTGLTVYALLFYALGIVPVSVARLMATAFYSMKDSTTPVVAGILSFVANIGFCVLLIEPLSHGGLALATTLASVVNLGVLAVVLRRRLGRMGITRMLSSALKSSGAAIVMGGLVWVTGTLLYSPEATLLVKLVVLLFMVLAGVGAYMGAASLMGMEEFSHLKELVRNRGSRK